VCLFTHLQEIEKAHHKLLKTLTEPAANQESEDQQCPSATVSRTPSLDRGTGDGKRELNLHRKLNDPADDDRVCTNLLPRTQPGKEGSPAEPKIQSTGF
ncbi:hypothetical protein GBF38_005182, partial [Nibea albiflora]